MKQDYLRQLDMFNPEGFKDKEITIVGSGSVGSFTCLSLAKMGMKNFEIWDFDKIEMHNLPNQFFIESQLGKKKNTAIKELVKKFVSDVNIKTKDKLKDTSVILSEVVVLTTDSMKSRKLAYEKCKDISRLLIDARMGGQVMVIYTVDLKDKEQREKYEKTLFTDDEAEIDRCTEKTIIYNVLGIASMICNQVKKTLNKEEYNFEIAFDYMNMMLVKG